MKAESSKLKGSFNAPFSFTVGEAFSRDSLFTVGEASKPRGSWQDATHTKRERAVEETQMARA
jgi:hypothetical protein